MECHLPLSTTQLSICGQFGDGSQKSVSRGAQDISRWYPVLLFSSQHGLCLVWEPHTTNKPLWWRKKYNKGEKSHWTIERFYTHVHQSLQQPPWFYSSLVCDIVPGMWSSDTWFCGPHHQKLSGFLPNTNLPEGSWPSQSFTAWNSQQNISHNIF